VYQRPLVNDNLQFLRSYPTKGLWRFQNLFEHLFFARSKTTKKTLVAYATNVKIIIKKLPVFGLILNNKEPLTELFIYIEYPFTTNQFSTSSNLVLAIRARVSALALNFIFKNSSSLSNVAKLSELRLSNALIESKLFPCN
jgi:hypothetical protein